MATDRKNNDYFIDETVIIKNTDIENIYNKTVNWLQRVDAKIITKNRPQLIEAKHGSRIWDGDPNILGRKTIHFEFNQAENDVLIVTQVSAPFYVYATDEIMRSWLLFFKELWEELGVVEMPLKIKQLYDADYILSKHNKNIIMNRAVLMATLSFICGYVVYLMHTWGRSEAFTMGFGLLLVLSSICINDFLTYINKKNRNFRIVLYGVIILGFIIILIGASMVLLY
jgi:hypothetical protein